MRDAPADQQGAATAARRAAYLPWPVFAALSAVLAVHLTATAVLEAQWRGLASPLAAVAAVFGR